MKIDIRVTPLGQVAAAPVKIPNWKLCQDLHLKHLPPQFSLIWMRVRVFLKGYRSLHVRSWQIQLGVDVVEAVQPELRKRL